MQQKLKYAHLMKTFYFYDLETFGIDAKVSRIAQFAGIRTDENLNIIGKADMFYVKSGHDTLPHPEACLVTGITPNKCEKIGIIEHQSMQKIMANFMAEPATCIVGYNNIRFDDEFIRYSLYRNLFDPYAWQYQNSNSRWDIIDVVRFCYALKPKESLNWVFDDAGISRFKLDKLAPANNISHHNAHDALADVRVTIEIAKRIKKTQGRLFAYALSLRNKKTVAQQLKLHIPILHTSRMYAAKEHCTKLVSALCYHPHYKERALVFDLSKDAEMLLDLSTSELKLRLFGKEEDLEGKERLALKELIFNKSPMFIASKKPPAHLDIDVKKCLAHLEIIKQHIKSIEAKLTEVYTPTEIKKTKDVDQMLYDGFIEKNDRNLLDAVHQMDNSTLANYHPNFVDGRLAQLLIRFKARNYPNTLSEAEAEAWFEIVQNRLQTGADGYLSLSAYFAILEVMRAHHPEKKPLWQALENYGESFL